MNQKQLTLLIVLGLVIGGLGIVVSQRKAASWNRTEGGLGEKVLGEFPVNDVAQVYVKQTNAELNLVKGEIWTVKERWGYPANFSDVAGFIRKASELKIVSPVSVGPSQLGRLELLAPEKADTVGAGTLVEMRDKDGKVVKSLLLGKSQMRGSGGDEMGGGYPVGRYLMVPGNSRSASVVSETFSEISTKPEGWLSKDWFKVEKLKSVSLVTTNATNNWRLARESETGSWSLVDKKDEEQVETNKLSSVGFVLSSPSFNDVMSPGAAPETTGMNQPSVATLETFDGFTYTVKIGATAAEENHHLNVTVAANLVRERPPVADEKPEDKEKLDKEFKEKLGKFEEKLKKEQSFAKWTYLVSKWTIDPLLKDRKEFLAVKKEDAGMPPVPAADATPPPVNLPDLLNTLPVPGN